MTDSTNNENKISRRGLLPILGLALLAPFVGFGNSLKLDKEIDNENEEYQTLLKADGTVVKVKTKTVKNSKVVKKDMSNKSLLSWLTKQ